MGWKNWAIISWVTIITDPNDNKVKINWFYLRKSSWA